MVWIVVNGQPGSETVALYLVIIYFTLPAFFFLPWFAGFRSEMIGGGRGIGEKKTKHLCEKQENKWCSASYT